MKKYNCSLKCKISDNNSQIISEYSISHQMKIIHKTQDNKKIHTHHRHTDTDTYDIHNLIFTKDLLMY
jgi:hypothetical protein